LRIRTTLDDTFNGGGSFEVKVIVDGPGFERKCDTGLYFACITFVHDGDVAAVHAQPIAKCKLNTPLSGFEVGPGRSIACPSNIKWNIEKQGLG
jgi:hypothetical protein